MPRGGPARVRLLHVPYSFSQQAMVVEAHGETGGVARVTVPRRQPEPSASNAIFVGDALALGAAQEPLRAVRDHRGEALSESMRLVSSGAVVAMGCRALSSAPVVLVHEPGPQLEWMRRCAAQGAFVIVVSEAAPAPGLASGSSRLWGAGILGWARGFDEDLAQVALSTITMDQHPALAN